MYNSWTMPLATVYAAAFCAVTTVPLPAIADQITYNCQGNGDHLTITVDTIRKRAHLTSGPPTFTEDLVDGNQHASLSGMMREFVRVIGSTIEVGEQNALNGAISRDYKITPPRGVFRMPAIHQIFQMTCR